MTTLKCWWSASKRLRIARALYLCSYMYNETLGTYAMPGHMILILLYMIMALFVSIRHYHDLGLHLYIQWPSLFLFLSVFAVVTYTTAAMVYEKSANLKSSMKTTKLNSWEKAQLRAMRPMRCEVGQFFYIQLSTAFLFLITVMDNAIGLLVFTSEDW